MEIFIIERDQQWELGGQSGETSPSFQLDRIRLFQYFVQMAGRIMSSFVAYLALVLIFAGYIKTT